MSIQTTRADAPPASFADDHHVEGLAVSLNWVPPTQVLNCDEHMPLTPSPLVAVLALAAALAWGWVG